MDPVVDPENAGTDQFEDEAVERVVTAAEQSLADLGAMPAMSKEQALVLEHTLHEAREALHDSVLLFVDDRPEYLVEYVKPLQVATDGQATLVRCEEQTLSELAQEIVASDSDVVLVDYFLKAGGVPGLEPEGQSDYFNGADLIREIRRIEDPAAPKILIGFSADSMFTEFAEAGANGATTKLDPVEDDLAQRLEFTPSHLAVTNVARIVTDLQARTEPARSFSVAGIDEDGYDKAALVAQALFGNNIVNYREINLPDCG